MSKVKKYYKIYQLNPLSVAGNSSGNNFCFKEVIISGSKDGLFNKYEDAQKHIEDDELLSGKYLVIQELVVKAKED